MRDFCEAVLCNLKLEILRSEKISRGWKDQEELMETVYSLADQMMLGTDRAGGIGVACIGPLDSIEGVIESPPYFNGIHDVPLVTTFGVLVVFIAAFYLLCWYLIQRGRGLRS